MASAATPTSPASAGSTQFDWTSAVRPLLAATYGNFQPADLVKLAKCIEASREQIMNHDVEFEPFYSLFVALATHHLCSNATSIPRANLPTVTNACRVLAEFILNRLEKQPPQCSVMPKQFVLLVKSLSKGLGFLQRADIITLAALMKSSQLPPHIRATIGAEKLAEEDSQKGRKKDRAAAGGPQSPARSESVLSNLVEILSAPVPPTGQPTEKAKEASSKPSTPTDSSKDVKDQFVNECMQHLMRLNAGSTLIDVCLKLPFLARYSLMFRDMVRGESPFSSINSSEYQSIFDSYSSFLNDIVMVSRVVVLPLMEPLTPDRLGKLCTLGCTCLLAACTVVTAFNTHSQKTDVDTSTVQELEGFTNSVVEKSLLVFSTILNNVQGSQSAGASQLQNMRALGSWCLASSLNHMLGSFEMNGAVVCIAQQLLALLQPLLTDLKNDASKADDIMELTVSSVLTPWQRFDFINKRCKLLPVLLTVAHDSCLRGIDMFNETRTAVRSTVSDAGSAGAVGARSQFQDVDAETDGSQAQSIPNTPSESDSEPLLGSWLEELLSSVPQLVDSAVKQSAGILHGGVRRRTTAASDSSGGLGVKEDAHTYLSLSITCLRMLSDDLLCGYHADRLNKDILSCWTEQEIGHLATLIRTTERQTEARYSSDEALLELKATLTKFMHNLVANNLMKESSEESLLSKLGIALGPEDAKSEWPLTLSPFLAGILCQMLILRQNKERDESGHSETGDVIIRIWHRLLITLKNKTFEQHDCIDITDVNVEHLQVLISLFHSLPLMQKKAVLLDVCGTIRDVVRENKKSRFLNNNVSSHFTRILLIFEYMLRFFYDPPQALLQQLKRNVFAIQSRGSAEDGEEIPSFSPSSQSIAVHFACGEIEEIYRAEMPITVQMKMKPFFYNLAPSFSPQEVPKLDGLAATFIQNSFDYNDFYECCCQLTCFFDSARAPSDQTTPFYRAVLRYSCTMVWRILKLLPPSVGFMENSVSWSVDNINNASIAQTRVFLLSTGIRLSEAPFAGWVKDGLIKQGQNAEQVDDLIKKVTNKNKDAALIMRLIEKNIEKMRSNWDVDSWESSGRSFPSFVDLVYSDMLLCRAHALLDSSQHSDTAQRIPNEAIPVQTFELILIDLFKAAHTLLIERIVRSTEPFPNTTTARNAALKVMSLCGSNPHQTSDVATLCWHHAHSSLRNAVEFWNRRALNEFPAVGAWRNEFAQDFAPVDSYLTSVYSAHIGGLASDWLSSLFITMKRLLHSSFHLLADTSSWYPGCLSKNEVDQLIVPILFDVMTSYLSDYAFSLLVNVHGAQEHAILQERIYWHALPTAYEIATAHAWTSDKAVEPEVAGHCLRVLESGLEVAAGRKALIYVLTSVGNISSLLSASVRPDAGLGFTTALILLLGKIFQTAEMCTHEKEFTEFCHGIFKTFTLEPQLLQQLLSNVFIVKEGESAITNRHTVMTECCSFLEAVARSANRSISCGSIEMSRSLLQHMVPVMTAMLTDSHQFVSMEDASPRGPFTQLFYTLTRFASVGKGVGHADLLKAASEWMTQCTTRLSNDQALASIKAGDDTASLGVLSESMSTILNYLSDLVKLFDQKKSDALATSYDSDASSGEHETDGLEDVTVQAEDEDSAGEESDEDALDSKLCTFTVTQKEFMNQHWYHCHTCNMVDGEGVCTVCAKVCHKGHDLSYSKYGSFFCDCGAKGETVCQALTKRNRSKPASKTPPTAAEEAAAVEVARASTSLGRGKTRARVSATAQGRKSTEEQKKFVLFYGDNRDREELRKQVISIKAEIVKNLLQFLGKISPAVTAAAETNSSIGSSSKLRQALTELALCDEMRCNTVETIAKLTGGSQENAFENVNVKLSFSGDQGQTIKQLLMNHVLHRTCLACASSVNRRKQFLVVAHDRCKIAIMHLSSFLKQVDNGKKKPTLSRSASESFPFTILSIAENPMCEDYVALCGLKECVIMTLAPSGSLSDRLTLSLGLDVGNFVIKALWLPGSATEIALITADFVRIYDLTKSCSRPEYDFLLPAGKIRDATFVCRETLRGLERNLLLMTSSGFLYVQQLGPQCRNEEHGSFYITDVLEIQHEELEESNGNLGGGGVSVYYSHSLQLLFVSYVSGKNIVGSVNFTATGLGSTRKMHTITWKSGQKSLSAQALYRWSELPGHPGVFSAMTHASQTPVVVYVRPRSILVQEITLPPKAKALDAILCRNMNNNGECSSCILLLCEDGSIRTVSVSKELTNFWIKKPSSLHFPVVPTTYRRSKRAWKQDRSEASEFPVEFFEQCQQLMDLDFGGSDLLQIYNTLQLRNRLQTSNLYVACARTGAFQLEVLNREPGMVICGVRVEVGKHSVDKSPTYVEVFGRKRVISGLTHGRWFDLPFSKEESISIGNKLAITFGPSLDAGGVCIVDSVKVYGKTKDAFGWPDDAEDDVVPMPIVAESREASLHASMSGVDEQQQQAPSACYAREMGEFERLVKSAFETLASTFVTFNDLKEFHESAKGLAINTLTSSVHSDTIRSAKVILRLLASSKTDYYANKDAYVLKHVASGLRRPEASSDPEFFAFLVSLARSISRVRPQSLVAGVEAEQSLLAYLPDTFWKLQSQVSPRRLICPVGSVEMENVEGLVHAVVGVLHAPCVADVSYTPRVVKALMKFLLSENVTIAMACRQAICMIYRQKLKKKRALSSSSAPPPPKPPVSPKPMAGAGASASTSQGARHPPRGRGSLLQLQQQQRQAPPEQAPFALMGDANLPGNALLLEDPDGVDQVYEMHADGDEEAMMELAIALSLQDQAANVGAVQDVPPVDHGNCPSVSVQESTDGGHTSDTTGSGLSDDEGSTAATQGSTLRVSPSDDRPGTDSFTGAASDSGGSGAESGSGRSSNDGESARSTGRRGSAGSPPPPPPPPPPPGEGKDGEKKDSKLILAFLDSLIESLPELDGLNGIRCIAYMQVITNLLSSLECADAAERKLVMKLLDTILAGLDFSPEAAANFCKRVSRSEVVLLKLRFITVLLSRSKGRTRQQMSEADAFICTYTADALLKRGILDYCLVVLKTLLRTNQPTDGASSSAKVLSLRPLISPPDLAPFFLRPYVKEHSRDVFESYTQLVTEMVMRLPYQVKKVADMCRGAIAAPNFEPAWTSVLCEFLRSEQTSFVKKHIRKLFMFICGSKEKYRQMRDVHSLEFDLKFIKSLCSPDDATNEAMPRRQLNLDYGTLNVVMDHLKSCCDIALNRTVNWQKFCVSNTDMFCYLVYLSLVVDDNIAATVLSLLNTAVSLPEGKEPKKKLEAKKEEPDKQLFSDKHAATLGELILNEKNLPLLVACLRRYLFECNMTERRWQMHAVVKALFNCIGSHPQQRLLDIMWRDLWPDVPLHGRKAVQFVDLLGYFTLTLATPQRIATCATNVLKLLETQNQMLSQHTNANVYNALASLLEFDGYYLESNPCLVCNNPEVPMTNLKLSSVKMDARFTTNSQILKLVGSHEISKITLKISEIRRTKMIMRLSLYYSNKSLQSAVELKNRPDLWILAKRFTLTQNQQELKMEFAVPIVACNLVMEYTQFYETPLTASEMMHCPRCSASVPAHPGVCNNCGENVYQCHKCRAINYDERDPFLCNACGYSKYGKFDYTLTARPVAGVEPIENEEDRKKVCNLINSLLEKADQIYRQLQTNRQQIETALARISGQDLSADEGSSTSPLAVTTTTGQLASSGAMTFVTKNIQQVALKYSRDCRAAFDELSKVVQKIIANRVELVEYDRRVRERLGLPPGMEKIRVLQSSPKCFGCAAATAQQCILLIRGMTSSASATNKLITSQKELMSELIDVAVKQSSARARQAARELVCSIINDQEEATDMVCKHITDKVTRALREPNWSTTVVTSLVQVELHLLAASLQLMDRCWERRLRCALDLFMKSTVSPSNATVEAITMPLLQMLQSIIFPPPFASEKHKGKSVADVASVTPAVNDLRVSIIPWLDGGGRASASGSCQSYSEWLTAKKSNGTTSATPASTGPVVLAQESWLEKALFCPNSIQLRATAGAIFKQICATAPMRKALVLDLLTRHLKLISELGDRAHEFVSLYQSLIEDEQWKVYVSMHGILPQVSNLILKEIETLSGLESSTLATDIAQGYTIKVLTDMMISLVEIEKVRKRWKSQLLSPVLHSYLAVRAIVVQRTKLIDDAQAKLLELLELLTTGTEKETKEFMMICVDTVKRSAPDDVRTPVFIFERLCSIVHPEEKEVGEFLVNIEKDPAQEDFLQGRMAGNPYNSNDAGMGPLMRDIKNKICRDCELLSLLEDDTGMELLVNGKIISLDLTVSEVYKKVWQPHHAGEAMLVIYRMRGLLGDATEEFIETLAPKKGEAINEEEVFKLAGVMSEGAGLEVMLDRLSSVRNVTHASPLLSVLLTLFEYCVKVKRNRARLIEPGLKAIPRLLACLQLVLSSKDAAALPYAEKIFSILDRIIGEANELGESQFRALFGTDQMNSVYEYLLNLVLDDQSTCSGSVREALLRTLPNLALGSEARTKLLINYFSPYIKFDSYDSEPNVKASTALDSFCIATKGILHTKYGHELKQRFIEANFLGSATKYLVDNCPPLFKIGVTMDSPDWKEFLSRPSLKYILRILAGMSRGHEPSQVAVAKDCIPIIHRLEQVSSEEHLGTLAEAVMEALRENPSVAKRIIEVREETRAKKKQMAMAMRKSQLAQMGMKIGDKGLVRVESGVLKDADLREETGLICSICQEGYMAAPQKVLGIYTYSKRSNAEDYETKARKTPAYSTVTHFNVIHIDCHQTAVRSARGRDEWESAMLHNANTRCNGLLPLWGPNISESEYAGHLSRHNQYIQEHTSVTDIGFVTAVHDLKLLLNRFAHEKSFADETGGGGRSSNIHLLPYLTQVSLYMLISANQLQAQTKVIQTYFGLRPPDWVSLGFESEGHVYNCVLTFLLSPPAEWQTRRVELLKRMIVTAQARQVARAGASKSLPDTAVKDYLVYKPYLLFLAMVNGFYKHLYPDVKCEKEADWPSVLQLYVRNNDAKLSEATSKLLKFFEEDLLPCESFTELFDVCGFLMDVPNADDFVAATLALVS